MNVTLIDSPVANVANIARALRHVGADLEITADRKLISSAGKIVLPGVGSFAAAMQWLNKSGVASVLREAVFERGATLLGICVGHQVLFEASHEMGTTPGLGFIKGEVVRLQGSLPVPQIGWNSIRYESDVSDKGGPRREEGLFTSLASNTSFYFVNSYAAIRCDRASAWADYEGPFVAAVDATAGKGHVYGVQFHPEKSSGAGLQVLRNFVERLR